MTSSLRLSWSTVVFLKSFVILGLSLKVNRLSEKSLDFAKSKRPRSEETKQRALRLPQGDFLDLKDCIKLLRIRMLIESHWQGKL